MEEELHSAVGQGQRAAGIEHSLRNQPDEAARADRQEYFDRGGDPTPEEIEAGLSIPKFAHWRTLRDNFLGYDPATLKAVESVIREGFRGGRGKTATTAPKPKIDLSRTREISGLRSQPRA